MAGDLLSLLSHASQSLSGAQGAASTAANNIQNVNTPGYARQTAAIEASLPGDLYNGVYLGQGSRLASVRQNRDRFLESQVPNAFAQSSFSKTKSSALSAVRIFDPGQPGGLGEAMSGFFDSLRLLSQNPSDRALRDSTVNSSKNLASVFQRSYQDIETARTALDGQIAGNVDEANRLAQQVATFNKQINLARLTSGGEPNALLDARQKAQDRLSELTGATPVTDAAGNVSLMLPKGGAIVAGDRASTLSTQADPNNTGHLKLLIRSGDSTTASELPSGALSGEMGGLLDARDGTLKTSLDGLDKLAFDFATSMNAAHASGRDLTNAAGGDLFVVASQSGAARQIAVNTTITQDPRRLATGQGGGPGDNAGVKALLGVETTALASGDTPLNTYANIVSDFGADSRAANAASEHDGALRSHLEEMRDSVIGVSIDEEMVLMTKAQRAYEAISRVINTSNQMLDTLLKLGNG